MILIATGALAVACGPTVLKPHLHEPAQANLPAHPRELKVHMKSGELYVLDSWRFSSDDVLQGSGTRYTALREPAGTGQHSLPVGDVALVETNERATAASLGVVGLGALTTFWGTLSVICAVNPKSCFGSCPTFYVEGDDQRPRAEGFSASVARALEARDVDALAGVRAHDGRVVLWMRNEALETQAVRRVRLLAVPRPAGGRVFATGDGRFLPALHVLAPDSCRGPEGSCLAPVARDDEEERRSATDDADLATREELELAFAAPPARAGIVIGARQSLLSTFLFYQTLAYMGRSAGDWLASVERGGAERARDMVGMERVLGGIDVAVADADGAWHGVGSFAEAGPIAGDVQVVPIEAPTVPGPLRVRLRMAKGRWRVGWVALAELGPAVTATPIQPSDVERDGRSDAAALASLRAGNRHLITLPGAAYRLSFPAPEETSELFLESEGYYYEWMRREWLEEEDPGMVALILGRPEEALRVLAGPFKDGEEGAEQTFWSSRFRR